MLRKYYLLGSIALFFLSGCASVTSNPAFHNDKHHNKQKKQSDEITDKDIASHVLTIDPDGKLNFIGCDGKDRATLDWCGEMSYEQKLDNYLNNIITNLKASDKELLIYIHGGLNSKKNALERAKKKYKLILNDKENPRYPVFINWHSGPITTYWNHIWRIRQGEKEENILKKIISSPVYLLTDIGNSIVNTPKAWVVSGGHWFDSTFKSKKTQDIRDDIAALKGTNIHFNGDKNVSKLFRHIQWGLTSPIKAVTTPFTYTMAKPAWDIMLRRTNTLFYTPEDLQKSHEVEKNRKGKMQKTGEIKGEIFRTVMLPKRQFKSGNGALYRFLLSLETQLKERDVKITLIGHSMGAIVVNNIINLGLNLTYDNIVHMASADSTENLFNKVVPYIDCSLERTCNNKVGYTPVNFYSLYLHPDNENREVSAGGLTPSGSLLTWIDGMYTIPKTVLDKRSGRWDNIVRTIELIPEDDPNRNNIRGQMHFTIFGIQKDKECTKDELKGLNCTAQEHGDFGDLPFWREEVWKGEHLSAQGE
ncbi:hypothetical protein H206_03111 [Candidatus Electrothrix aarhusensis]|uniref:Alpha/beta hydrolase n=1 Tax=Candidatus Electrothrix aarhusensis TaxID=1859131 RepID=A0A3S4TBD2_9BACT|nr:hypothetical protein H206_03111 [Candidatus Electrothrix aarhusensis]